MIRLANSSLTAFVAVVFVAPGWVRSEPTAAPVTYELMINGENFSVEENRVAKLKSSQKPGVEYEVAIWVAPMQRLRLATCQFDYDRLARVDVDRKKPLQTVQIRHELGFSMLATDMGQPFDEKAQSELLDVLSQSLVASFEEISDKVETSKPHTRKFTGAAGRGIMVRYTDKQGYGHTGLTYVLSGANFTATCVVQYLDADKDDVLPLIKKTLDSFRGLDPTPPPDRPKG